MQATARLRGGECLSKEYRHYSEPLRWRCAQGHEWEVMPAGILNNGTWCRRCSGKAKRSIADARELARERGGRCLSKEYVNGSTPLRWRCREGHEWRAAFGNVRTGSWCPRCAVRNPISIEELHEVARERGGECLSSEYGHSRAKLRWRCAEGHEWRATGYRVARKGYWCRICSARLSDGLERMHAVARERGGECLEREYRGAEVKARWRCAEGHTWRAMFHNVANGSWCPKCAQRERSRLAPFRGAATKHGGELLSVDVGSAADVARWRCAEGHEFRMTVAKVLGGAWCARCDRDGAELERGSIAARVRAWCRRRTEPFTTEDLAAAMPGMKRTTLNATLNRMVKQGDTIQRADKPGRFRQRV